MTVARPYILITRPEEDAAPLAADLEKRGFKPLVAPMLSIRPIEDAAMQTRGIQGLLFTSANGVRAFAAQSDRRGAAAWCVGAATSVVARRLGFHDVRTAAGDVESLADLVIKNVDPKQGALLHAAGSAIAGDLSGRLSKAGFTVCRAVLYEAVPATALPEEAAAALRAGTVRAVLFFSPRTADSFVRLVEEAGLADACRGVDAVCLSEAVAESARRLPWANVIASAQPNQFALVTAAKEAADQDKGAT